MPDSIGQPYPNPTTAAQVAANRAWFDAQVQADQQAQARQVIDTMRGVPTLHPDVYQLPDVRVSTPPWGLIIAGAILYWLVFMDGKGGRRDY